MIEQESLASVGEERTRMLERILDLVTRELRVAVTVKVLESGLHAHEELV